jgi:hypothetical protein
MKTRKPKITKRVIGLARTINTERGYLAAIRFIRSELRDDFLVPAEREFQRAKVIFRMYVA